MAEPISPIHIISLEHNRIALANYDINRDKVVISNVQREQENAVEFSNLFTNGFLEENVMALNGPAFAHLLGSENLQDIKNKLFISAQTNYDIDSLVPEQVLFLTMFYHIHSLADIGSENMPSIQNTFTELFRKLVERIRVEPSSQTLFGQPIASVSAFFDRVQRNLIEDRRNHITLAAFLEMLEGGATAVQNYINEGQQRLTANNNSITTQGTPYTSNTRRGLNAISNPSFDNNENEDGPEPLENGVVLDEDARSVRSQEASVHGSIGTGAPSNYSVRTPSLIKTVGSIELGNLKPDSASASQRTKITDPDLLELQQRLETLGKASTAKVPAAVSAAAPLLPPAISAALKKGASTKAPPVLRNSKGRPVRSSLKKPKSAANAKAVTRKHARFTRGNHPGVVEYTYNKNAPPSGIITNTENVLRGTLYETQQSLGHLGSRRITGSKPEPPYVPEHKKKA